MLALSPRRGAAAGLTAPRRAALRTDPASGKHIKPNFNSAKNSFLSALVLVEQEKIFGVM